MTLLEKNREVLRRMENPQPVAERVKAIFEAGKREQLLLAQDAAGAGFAPLAASTLKKPRLDIDPLIPRGEASDIITHYTVTVTSSPGLLTIEAGWPDLPWVQYHRTGTRRMPQRDPGGFRDADRLAAVDALSAYVWRGDGSG